LTLVLNWGDGTLGGPVDGGWGVGFVEDLNVLGGVGCLETVELLSLLGGPVSEEVDTMGGARVLGVKIFDFGEGLLEDLGSELEFSLGGVGSTEFGDESHEFVVFGGEDFGFEGSGLVEVETSGGEGSGTGKSGDESLGVHV